MEYSPARAIILNTLTDLLGEHFLLTGTETQVKYDAHKVTESAPEREDTQVRYFQDLIARSKLSINLARYGSNLATGTGAIMAYTTDLRSGLLIMAGSEIVRWALRKTIWERSRNLEEMMTKPNQ